MSTISKIEDTNKQSSVNVLVSRPGEIPYCVCVFNSVKLAKQTYRYPIKQTGLNDFWLCIGCVLLLFLFALYLEEAYIQTNDLIYVIKDLVCV